MFRTEERLMTLGKTFHLYQMRNKRYLKIKDVPDTTFKLPSPKPHSHLIHLYYNQFTCKMPVLRRDERMRFSDLKMSDKSKGPNTEFIKDHGSLFSADVGIFSCDFKGNSAWIRDLFCKGDRTRIPYGLEGGGGQGKGVWRGHLDLTSLDLCN